MSHTIRIKRSGEPGGVPQTLMPGELAYNYHDRRLYIGGPNGEIHEVGGEGQIVVEASAAPAPPSPPPPAETPPPLQNIYTTSGIRRRLLPFEG